MKTPCKYNPMHVCDDGCATECRLWRQAQPTESIPGPKEGTVFHNGIDGQCVVKSVWKSRFGDWKVSYYTANGGGGMMSLDHFNQTVAMRHAEETPCGPMCSVDDHRRYASRGRCALCGSSFYPPNATAQATTPAPTNDDHGNKQ